MALFRWDSVGFSEIFFVKFYLPLKTLWWKWFVNPDSHSNMVQNAFLCFKRFFPWILLNFRKIFPFKRCSEKFFFENSEICIQNRLPTGLKSRSNECTFWNSFEHAQLEVILAKTKNLFFTVFQLDSRNFFSQNLIFSRRRFDWMRLWIRILFLT